MRYRELGTSGIQVSQIALGTWAMGDNKYWGEQEEKASHDTIFAALDCGVTFIDTAEGYGNSEEVIGGALKQRRKEAVIATKAYGDNLKPDMLSTALETSLKRLQTEYVDLYYIHWPNLAVPLEETLGALGKLKQEGKIRAAAICNFGPKKMKELRGLAGRKLVDVVTHQLPYSLLWRAIEGPILEETRAAGMGVVAYSPLAQGLLSGQWRTMADVPKHIQVTRYYNSANGIASHGEAGAEQEIFTALDGLDALCREAGVTMPQLALAWMFAQPDVVSVLAGARTPAEIRENAVATDLKVPPSIIERATKLSEPARKKLGPNPDMWMNAATTRYV